MRHTPGPWIIRYGCVSESDEGFGIASSNADDPRMVCENWPCSTTKETRAAMQADARLIAAAPALLEACEAMLSCHCPGPPGSYCGHHLTAKLAIAQAQPSGGVD